MGESAIQQFYKDQTVFVTGATGFLGKVLLEKLLRSTEVSTIYVLVREKSGKTAITRADELLEDVIFDRLKQECPKFKHKIVTISGDCSNSGLGLSITDKEKIIANTNIIFHVAATVRFDENIKFAYAINVQSAREIMELARQMRQLKSVLYVSTAFSHCYLRKIDEKFYDCPDYEAIGKALEKLSTSEACELTPSLLGKKWPNTYTFTKALAESLVRNHGKGLPVGVYRPGIVISTYKEPVRGWIDNMYGPTGITAGAASGMLRTFYCDINKHADMVPVDTCVAGLIVAAKDVNLKHSDQNRSPEDIPIYNYVSSTENPLMWEEFMALNLIYSVKYPFAKTMWNLKVKPTRSKLVYFYSKLVYHYLPAFLLDIGSMLLGHSPRFLTAYSKIHKFTSVLAYFCDRDWNFTNDNVVKLWEQLSETDKQLFPLSMRTVHWLEFCREYVKGVRIYLFKDSLDTLDLAKKRRRWFWRIGAIGNVIFYYILATLITTGLTNLFLFIHNKIL